MRRSAPLNAKVPTRHYSDGMDTPLTQPRPVERLVAGQATSDGAGVKLTRVLTQDLQHRLDPFLMLDAFCSDDGLDSTRARPGCWRVMLRMRCIPWRARG